MKYAQIKGYNASRVALGVSGFGTLQTQTESEEILQCYIDRGGNIIDTANVYMNWDPRAPERSSGEKALGRLFKMNPGLRDKLIVCTKGAHFESTDPANTPRVNEGCITYDVNDSLKNLGIDRIDLYWLHRDNPTYPVHLIMDALFEAQDAGKIAHYGASNWSASRISEANAYARQTGREGFFGSQIQHSYIHPLDIDAHASRYFDEALEGKIYLDEQLALFCFTSLARGYMTKILNDIQLGDNLIRFFDCPSNRERAARAETVAKQVGGGHNAEQVGLAYLHALPYNTVTLVSYTSVDQIKNSMDCDIDLTQEQIRYLSEDKISPIRKQQPLH